MRPGRGRPAVSRSGKGTGSPGVPRSRGGESHGSPVPAVRRGNDGSPGQMPAVVGNGGARLAVFLVGHPGRR